MPTIGDTSIERFKYEGITLEQWKELKAILARRFKFALKEDIGDLKEAIKTLADRIDRVSWGSGAEHRFPNERSKQ